jgi:CheY-like chemotaxis protein
LVRDVILICDDEEPLRALLRATLAGLGHELIEASDGERALELVRERRPEVLVLDVMMPGRSGLEIVREIRDQPELDATKIVVVSTHAEAGHADEAVRTGANRFLGKPFSPFALEQVVAELLAA